MKPTALFKNSVRNRAKHILFPSITILSPLTRTQNRTTAHCTVRKKKRMWKKHSSGPYFSRAISVEPLPLTNPCRNPPTPLPVLEILADLVLTQLFLMYNLYLRWGSSFHGDGENFRPQHLDVCQLGKAVPKQNFHSPLMFGFYGVGTASIGICPAVSQVTRILLRSLFTALLIGEVVPSDDFRRVTFSQCNINDLPGYTGDWRLKYISFTEGRDLE